MCNELPKLAGNDGGVYVDVLKLLILCLNLLIIQDRLLIIHQYKADLELGTKLKKWNMLFMIKLLDYYKLYE